MKLKAIHLAWAVQGLLGAAGLSLSVCSTQNLGSYQNTLIWMSNGLCYDKCKADGYVVAILQHYDCYCSNYVPLDTSSMSSCSDICPGNGYEQCANDGYYGYLLISTPSGTQGSPLSSATSELESSTSMSSSVADTTSSQYSESSSTPSTSSTSSRSSRSSSSSTTSSSSSAYSSSTYSSSTYSSSEQATSTSADTATSTLGLSSIYSSSQDFIMSTTAEESSTSQSSTYSLTKAADSTSLQESDSATSSSISTSSQETSSSSSSSKSSKSSASSTSVGPTTIYSVRTLNGATSEVVKTRYITAYPTEASSTLTSSETSSDLENGSVHNGSGNSNESQNSFFDSTGKVAGTFTAVGVVVVGIVMGLMYCCCIKRRKDDVDDTDDEAMSANDDFSEVHEKHLDGKNSHTACDVAPTTNANSLRTHSNSNSISSNLKRNSSSKSILSLFSPANGLAGGINRSQSRKKLNEKKKGDDQITNEWMFPINEFDSRLDPSTMFLNTNTSKRSLGDEVDYSRPILKIINPE